MIRATLTLSLVILSGACGGGSAGDMAAPVPHNFDQIRAEILSPSCANFISCHSSTSPAVNKLDLTKDPYAALVGVPAYNTQAAGEGLLRVKPCDPDNSFLVKKLELPLNLTDSNVGYGVSMPNGNGHLTPEQIKAIRDWISRGALRSEPVDVSGTTCNPEDMSASTGDMATQD
jgi:hypothetical protein